MARRPPLVRSLLAVALFVASAAAAQAPPAPEGAAAARLLTLEDAIETALGSNPALVAAGHARRGAEEGTRSAEARRLPRIDLTHLASRTTNPTMVFSNLLGQEKFGPANFAIPTLNEPDPLNDFQTRLTVTQPIYAGGRIDAGLEASRLMAESARGEESRARQETIARTIQAYQGVLLARRQVAVAEAARAAAEAHRRAAEALVEGGLAVPSDVLRVNVRLAEIEEMRIRAQAGESVARAGLEAEMGSAPEGPYELAEPGAAEAELPDVGEAVEIALARRSDLSAAQRGRLAAGEAARAAKGSRLPQVGVMAFYEIHNEQLIGSSGQNWAAMLAASWNLFDGTGSAAEVRKSREEELRAAALARGFESRIRLEVRQAHAELAGARARREAARAGVSQAEDAIRTVRDQYENGLATITDLLDQEAALTAARVRAVQAEHDCRNGEAALRLAMGTLGDEPSREVHP